MEVKIILFLLFVKCLQWLFTKPKKHNMLFCGIFGWAGKDPKKFNKDKFDKLGMYNIERGKDSCGISIDGDVALGVGHQNKNFLDFIINRNNLIPKKYPVVIGHTRNASIGNAVNESNAHPFGFGLNKKQEAYEFIGCHNGTLYNSEDLAKKYDVELNEKKVEQLPSGSYSTFSRKKIDSEILLEIIYTYKHFKVLSEYVGAAALMFTDTNNPNKVYLWKGASRLYDYSTSKTEEERPLYYYIESKNSLYVSSIENSLIAIGGIKDKNVFSFENNTLYIITDGDIKTAEEHKISRDKATQKELFNKTTNYDTRHSYNCYDYYTEKNKYKTESIINKHVKDMVTASNIYEESLLMNQNLYGKKVYFNKLRYYKKGHLITGIYTFIKGYGFYFLTEEPSRLKAYTRFKEIMYIPFIGGDFNFTIGVEELKKGNFDIPFTKFESQNFHYFVEGAKIRTHVDYQVLLSKFKELKKGEFLDHTNLSHATTHPIMDISVSTKSLHSQGIVYDGKLVSDIIAPLGSELIYNIDFGNLKKIKTNTYGKKLIFGDSSETKTFREKIKSFTEQKQINSLKALETLEASFEEELKLLLPASITKSYVEDLDEDDSLKELELLAGEFELISENLNEAIQGIEEHILKLQSFDDPSVDSKISQLKLLKDQITLTLERE